VVFFEGYITKNVKITSFTNIIKIEKNEMGGACSAYGGGEACTGFWWGNLGQRDQWGDPGVNGRIILRWIFRSDVSGYRVGRAAKG